MAQNRTKSLLKETAWFAVGSFGSRILTLLLVPFYTSILTKGEYGTVDIIINTVALAMPLLTLSVHDAAFRFAMDQDVQKERVLSGSLLVTLLSPVLLLALYPLVRLALPAVADYWWYFFFIFVGNTLCNTLSYYVKGIGRTDIYAIQGMVYTLVFAGLNVVLLAGFRLGIEGYLCSYVWANAAACVYMLLAGRLWRSVSRRHIRMDMLRQMLRYSMPLISAAVAWWVMTSIDRYMLLYMCSAEANGLYSVAHKLPTVISVVTTFFINAWQISAVRYKDDADIAEYTSRVYGMLFTFGTVMAFGMIACSEWLGWLFFQKEFYPAWTMMPCLTVATVFSTFSLFLGAQFTAQKRSDLHLKSNVIAMVVNVILNFLLIRLLGINGAAYGTMVSYFVVLVYRQIRVKRLIALRYPIGKMYGSCCLLMAAAVATSLKIPMSCWLAVLCLAAVVLMYGRECGAILRGLRDTLTCGHDEQGEGDGGC